MYWNWYSCLHFLDTTTLSLIAVTYSRVFHPCHMVPRFQLLHFPPLLSRATFSTPAFSVAPVLGPVCPDFCLNKWIWILQWHFTIECYSRNQAMNVCNVSNNSTSATQSYFKKCVTRGMVQTVIICSRKKWPDLLRWMLLKLWHSDSSCQGRLRADVSANKYPNNEKHRYLASHNQTTLIVNCQISTDDYSSRC